MQIGEMLVRAKVLSPADIDEAVSWQVLYGGRLGTNLLELGLVEERVVAETLGRQLGCEWTAGEVELAATMVQTIPAVVARRHEIVPWRIDGKKLKVLAIAPAENLAMFDEIGFRIGKIVKPVVAPEFRIHQLLRRYYGSNRQMRALDFGMKPKGKRQQEQERQAEQAELEKAADLMDDEAFAAIYNQVMEDRSRNPAGMAPHPTPAATAAVPAHVPAAMSPMLTPAWGTPAPRPSAPPAPRPTAPYDPAAWTAPTAGPPAPAPVISSPVTSNPAISQPAISQPVISSLLNSGPSNSNSPAPAIPPGWTAAPPAAVPSPPSGMPRPGAPSAPPVRSAPPAVAAPRAPTPPGVPRLVGPHAPITPAAMPARPVPPPAPAPRELEPVLDAASLLTPIPEDDDLPLLEAELVEDTGPVALEDDATQQRVWAEAFRDLEKELGDAEPAALAPAELSPLTFKEAVAEIARADGRDAVARAVLRYARSNAARAILLQVQGDVALGWDAVGEDLSPEVARRIAFPLTAPGAFRLVRESRSHYIGPLGKESGNVRFLKLAGKKWPASAVLLPVLFRARVVYILYVDNGHKQQVNPDVGELLILSQNISRSMEQLVASRSRAG